MECCLVAELAERRHTAVDPVTLWLVGRYEQHQHEVGRVTGGAEHAAPSARLVHGTAVDRPRLELGRHARPEPDERQRVVQDLGLRLVQQHLLAVPARAFDIQTLHDADGQHQLSHFRAQILRGWGS